MKFLPDPARGSRVSLCIAPFYFVYFSRFEFAGTGRGKAGGI